MKADMNTRTLTYGLYDIAALIPYQSKKLDYMKCALVADAEPTDGHMVLRNVWQGSERFRFPYCIDGSISKLRKHYLNLNLFGLWLQTKEFYCIYTENNQTLLNVSPWTDKKEVSLATAGPAFQGDDSFTMLFKPYTETSSILDLPCNCKYCAS